MRFLAFLVLAGLAGCQTLPPAAPPAMSESERAQSLALAQNACGACHSVVRYGISPNAAAPEFVMIANRPGLDRDTLGRWLRDAHNYPDEMNFEIGDAEVERLVAYILTLQEEGYQPPIQ